MLHDEGAVQLPRPLHHWRRTTVYIAVVVTVILILLLLDLVKGGSYDCW